MTSETLERIHQLTTERLELFRRASDGLMPEAERARMKQLTDEITKLWDLHRRQGHPPAIPPVMEDWERPRRGRRRVAKDSSQKVQWPEHAEAA